MNHPFLRRSLACSSILLLALGAFQGREPAATASPDPAAPAPWCRGVVGGPASTEAPLLAASAMHASARLFAVNPSFQSVDRALAAAMARPFVGDDRFLRDYVAALGDGEECVAQASSATLGPASIEMVGDVAVVHPGTGTLTLPEGARAVAIDVRGLPTSAPDLLDSAETGIPFDPVRNAIDAAAALALATPVSRPLTNARWFFGLPDEDVEEPQPDLFTSFAQPWELEPLPAGSPVDLPLAVITGKTLAPAAAELAVTLRLANRAWIFGEDVEMRVAESVWVPLGGEGLALRTQYFADPNTGLPFPDAVPADAHGGDPVELARGLAGLGAPPTLTPGPTTRPPIVATTDLTAQQPDTLGPGEARAGLVSVHGAARIFYGNFVESGDDIDPRLAEMMAAVDLAALSGGPIDRTFYFDVLRRFGQALHDGHNFTFDEARPFTGFIPLKIEEIGGEPVVRRSQVPGMSPGDAVVGIDGVPWQAWYAAQVPLTSAATDWYRFNLITRKHLLRVYGPRSFDTRSPDGSLHHVVAQPQPYADELPFGSSPVPRASGWLTDQGAPDVYYLAMSYEFSPDAPTALAAIAQGQGASAMIVDMRGYPNGDHYLVDSALMPTGYFYPDFRDPYAFAPGQYVFFDEGIDYPAGPAAGPPTYSGPIILLVGHDTVSAAENFADMLVDNQRPLHVVGRQSAGTNGSITGLEVLGHYSVSFTGEDMRNADGSQFVGIGITPDMPVTLTQANVSNGNDPELSAALTALGY
jgi:Peptidase family S41